MRLAEISRLAFMTLPNYSMIAVANAIEVLRMANRLSGADDYRWEIVSPSGEGVEASNGLLLGPTVACAAMARPDLLLACGGIEVRSAVDGRVTAALRRAGRDGVALGGLCTGSFALAAAGLLRGRRCAIHWENLAPIQQEFPDTDFVRDLYTIDRDRVTCTGGVAPLSLMLALVEARLGTAVAGGIRAQFMIERARSGAEPQHGRASPHADSRIERAILAMECSIEAPLQAHAVARDVGVSPRQLERLFRRHVGQSPAAYFAGLRLDRARSLLRETALPVTEVASACGYVTPSRFSAAYRGRFGRSPRDDRSGAFQLHRRLGDAHQPA